MDNNTDILHEAKKLPALPLDLDNTNPRLTFPIKAGELAELIRRWGREVYARAQQAPNEIRNQALKDAAKRCEEVAFDWGQAGETRKHSAAMYLANCILDMRTGSAAQAATDKSKIEGVKQPLFDKDPTNIQY